VTSDPIAASPRAVPYAVRFCQHCGEAIPRRPNEPASKYKTRRFCSPAHFRVHERAAGNPYSAPETLTPADLGREAELYRGLRYENVRLRGG
jgi:hypothetical protein